MRLLYLFLFFVVLSCSTGINNSPKNRTGIEGYVYSKNHIPEPDVYVSLYRSLVGGLIGPSDFMEKTNEKGYFFFDVPEGRYFLVARKRLSGSDTGPLRAGDRITVYNKNPIEVKPGKIFTLSLTLPEASGIFQKRVPKGDKPLTIKFKKEPHLPLKALIYEGDDIKKSPLYIVELSEKENIINIDLNKQYIIVIREHIKERIGQNEFYRIIGPLFSNDTDTLEIDF